jgi:hypothetical protein
MTVSDTTGPAVDDSHPADARAHGYSGAKHLAAWYTGDLNAACAAAAEKARARVTPTTSPTHDAHLGRKLSALYAGDLGSLLDSPN